MDEATLIKKLEKRIDNLFTNSHGNIPTNPKTWASVIQTSIARNEIESGDITENALGHALKYAVKKSLQSGAMSKTSTVIEIDESEAHDVDTSQIRRAIAFTKKYVRERLNRRTFPKIPAKWQKVLLNEVHPSFPFTFPQYALAPVANKVCQWYINGCPFEASEKLADTIPISRISLEWDEEIKNIKNEKETYQPIEMNGSKDEIDIFKTEKNGVDNEMLKEIKSLQINENNSPDIRNEEPCLLDFDNIQNNQFSGKDGGATNENLNSKELIKPKNHEESVSPEFTIKKDNVPYLSNIEENDLEKMHLLRNAIVCCIFCSSKLSLVKNLTFVSCFSKNKNKTKDCIGVLLNYVTKTLSSDWYSGSPSRSTKVRCIRCNNSLGWPHVVNEKKLYVFKNRNILYKLGSSELILSAADLKKQNPRFVTEAFWKFLKSNAKPLYKQTWECFKCTAINIERKQKKCEVCNYNRLYEDEWSCDFCTYYNKKIYSNCQMCESKNPNLKNSDNPKIPKSQPKKSEYSKTINDKKNINDLHLDFLESIEQRPNPVIPKKDEVLVDLTMFGIDTGVEDKKPKSENIPLDLETDKYSVQEKDKNVEILNSLANSEDFDKILSPEKSSEFSRIGFSEPPQKSKSPKIEVQDTNTWRENLRFGDRVDFRSSPQTLAQGHWVPGLIVQMRKEPNGLSLEVLFEGYNRVFEWAPLVSSRIAPHRSHFHEYNRPKILKQDLVHLTSYAETYPTDIAENCANVLRHEISGTKGLNGLKGRSEKIDESENYSNLLNKKMEKEKGRKEDDGICSEKIGNESSKSTLPNFKSKEEVEKYLQKMEPIEIREKSDLDLDNLTNTLINNYGGVNFIYGQKSVLDEDAGQKISSMFSNLEFKNDVIRFKYAENLPKLNRTHSAVPVEFRGMRSWGYLSERMARHSKKLSSTSDLKSQNYQAVDDTVDEQRKTVRLFLYSIRIAPKEESSRDASVKPMHSFGLLLEHEIKEPPSIDVFLHTKNVDRINTPYEGVVTFLAKGRIDFSFDQVEKIKRAHGFLYELLCRGKLHPELFMDCTFPMFLVVPLDDERCVDWICINRIFESVMKKKINLIDYIKAMKQSNKTNNTNIIEFEQLVLTLLYNTHEQHLYSFVRLRPELNANSLCSNENAKPGESWKDFLYNEHGFTLKYPEAPLVESYQIHPRAQGVLTPPVVMKSHVPPLMNLVPELCDVHPLPLRLVLEMPDIVSIIWGLQNLLSIKGLQRILPVPVSLPLLEEALTFSVVSSYKNYELLEFLGDSVLKYLATDYLFFKYKNTSSFSEGDLTSMRKELIKNETLKEYGESKRIFDYSLICQFQRKDYLPPCFVKSISMKHKFINPFVSDKQTADLVEAVLGATFLSETPLSRFRAVAKVLQWFGSCIDLVPIKSSFVLNQQVPERDNNHPELEKRVKELEKFLNYSFRNKQYAKEVLYRDTKATKNAQLLELLGDSVLDFLCTRKLFHVLPNSSPEDLTEARKELVCNDALAYTFKKFRLDRFLFKIEESLHISLSNFYCQDEDETSAILPIETSIEKDQNRGIKRSLAKMDKKRRNEFSGKNGGIWGNSIAASEKCPKKCGDFVESLIGSIYLDLGRDMIMTWKTIFPLTRFPKTEEALALDCEFVGVGSEGHYNALARVSIVDYDYNTLYDKFVKPNETVIDWRTEVSGIRKEDVVNGEDILLIQKEVASMIRNRILVGHNLDSDLGVLFLAHPKYLIRDTAKFRKFCPSGTVSLKTLVQKFLGIVIQTGEHSSVEDARETMKLYREFMAKDMRDVEDDLRDLKNLI